MDASKRLDFSFKTFLVCVALGIVGNILIRDTTWGVGFASFSILVLGAGALLARHKPMALSRGAVWACVGAVGFALLLAWRDSPTLKVLNGLAIFLLLGLAALKARGGDLRIGTVMDYPFRILGRVAGFLIDAFHLAELEGGWEKIGQERGGKLVSACFRGLLIATPLLLVFGGLFAAADAGFERMITQSVQFQPEEVTTGIMVTFMCTLVVGGLFRRLFIAEQDKPPVAQVVKPANLGAVEIGIALGALNALFGMFVAVQFRNFFGGENVIATTQGLGYADYARRGFFELATASLLVLPVLLGGHSLLAGKSPVAGKVYNVMAAILIGLVFVVMASAIHRMKMYVGAYGTSELRLYVLASIGWIGAVFAWFAATVLRARPQRFAFGALILLLAGVFTMNVANPEGIVAHANTSRRVGPVDISYLARLSGDAVPVLIEALPMLRPEDRARLETALAERKTQLARENWRSWSIGRAQAMSALEAEIPDRSVAMSGRSGSEGPLTGRG